MSEFLNSSKILIEELKITNLEDHEKISLLNELKLLVEKNINEIQDNPNSSNKEYIYKQITNDYYKLNTRDFIDIYKATRIDFKNENYCSNYKENTFHSDFYGRFISLEDSFEKEIFLLFYDKSIDIKLKNYLFEFFLFPNDIEKEKNYSDWKIIEPALVKKIENNYVIIKKGVISIENKFPIKEEVYIENLTNNYIDTNNDYLNIEVSRNDYILEKEIERIDDSLISEILDNFYLRSRNYFFLMNQVINLDIDLNQYDIEKKILLQKNIEGSYLSAKIRSIQNIFLLFISKDQKLHEQILTEAIFDLKTIENKYSQNWVIKKPAIIYLDKNKNFYHLYKKGIIEFHE